MAQSLTVQTQVNVPEVHVASMSDPDLATYLKLLEALSELAAPKDEPERIGGVRR
jgi:hypothetical protein